MPARIGLIIPASNRMVEQEMVRHTPPGVTAHVARLRMTGNHRGTLEALVPRGGQAAAEAAAAPPPLRACSGAPPPRRIVLLTPYSQHVTDEEAGFLREAGYDVL